MFADILDSGDYLHNLQSDMLIFLFASVFAGFHFITWSFSMPTVTELWMWRSASIALTSTPTLVLLFFKAAVSLRSYSFLALPLIGVLATVLLVLHSLIRLVIAVDSVVLLRSLPDAPYLVLSWSDAIPSF